MKKLLATPPGSPHKSQSPSCLSADRETPHSPSPTSIYGIEDYFRSPDSPEEHPFQVHGGIVKVEIGGVTIYRPFGEFHRAKSYCHLYGAQGQ
ncbi:hypothetical protein TNCV_185051 [Trichonephila clavipes]|nr:hypothetical protein TNCV_185051 [Trichonephila clavipes]